jgi:hypothetical protein
MTDEEVENRPMEDRPGIPPTHLGAVARMPMMGAVKRYHTEVGVEPQTTAHHSWGVAQILRAVVPRELLTAELLMAALDHDVPEFCTGDAKGTAKRAWPHLKSALDGAEAEVSHKMGLVTGSHLSEEQRHWLKWADMMECALWCHGMLGRTGAPIYEQMWRRALRGSREYGQANLILTPAAQCLQNMCSRRRDNE